MVYLDQQAQQDALDQPVKLDHLVQVVTVGHPGQLVARVQRDTRVQPGQLVALAAVAQQAPPAKQGQQEQLGHRVIQDSLVILVRVVYLV